MFNPASVLPAPGTPVIKHIDFRPSDFDRSMISAILSDVVSRPLMHPADLYQAYGRYPEGSFWAGCGQAPPIDRLKSQSTMNPRRMDSEQLDFNEL